MLAEPSDAKTSANVGAGEDEPLDRIRWVTPEGEAVSCVEKLKVLNEALTELRQTAQDAFEDAILIGCDEAQIRAVLARLVATLRNPYAKP